MSIVISRNQIACLPAQKEALLKQIEELKKAQLQLNDTHEKVCAQLEKEQYRFSPEGGLFVYEVSSA